MQYQSLVEKYKEQLIEDLFGLLSIESVRGEAQPDAPVGKGPKEALEYMLKLGERDGMLIKNVDNLAGHIEMGQGEKLFGVLGHVDVVPSGEGWDSHPFQPILKDGKIHARGIQDDKGPTMAAYYAMKILKEEGYELNRRLRLIIGTDEESDWKCTDAYFKTEEMPDLGFAPDATFPLIHGEKGITSFDIHINFNDMNQENIIKEGLKLEVFHSGERYNMVPEFATVTISNVHDIDTVTHQFEAFLENHGLSGSYNSSGHRVTLNLKGMSAHGSTPEVGVNAALKLFKFLNQLSFNQKSSKIIQFVNQYLVNNFKGEAFNMAHSHEDLGETSVNAGIFKVDENHVKFGINLRYPTGLDFEQKIHELNETFKKEQFYIDNITHQEPHFVEKEEPFVQLLLKVYRNHVNDDREPFTIGGGTYARTLDKGVAFGAMFEETEDSMHQKNERMKVEELLLATTIYLEALHKICVLNSI